MSWQRPEPATVFKAVDVYRKHACPTGSPPAAVGKRIETLKASQPAIFDSAVWERDNPTQTARYSLRLGNTAYPHMKLVVEAAPVPVATTGALPQELPKTAGVTPLLGLLGLLSFGAAGTLRLLRRSA